MKVLKKMLLIKWYYIEHQIINFDSLNFMTGKNGSGKSTIIDAMQIVMLGDTRGTFFNKAANDRGGRTLDGYLRGEISDDGDVGFKSVRTGRFTSYIALEFFDTVERKSFTCGVVFDSYKDAPTDHMFFILQSEIPENHFVDEETNIPMDYKKLKTYFATHYKNKFTTYKESNKSYQNDFLAKMGGLKPKFFNLFKKSVTFTPIDDIEKFISEYVCDVTNEIDIEKMKENIRHYKELEKEAQAMEARKEELEKIEELFNSYDLDVQQEYMQRFLFLESALQIETDNLEKNKREYLRNVDEIKKLEDEKLLIENKTDKLSKIRDDKTIERASSDIGKRQDTLQNELNKTNEQLIGINRITKKLIENFRGKVAKWRVNIKEFLEEKNSVQDEKIINIATNLKDNIQYLLSINEDNISNLDEEALMEIKEQMENINSFSNEVFFKNVSMENKLKEKQANLENEINNLKTGIKPYESNLIAFKNIIKEELEKTFNENIEIEILADLLEIKNLKWKEAIECYINNQMFYIVIAPKYYSEAAKIYRRIAKDNRYNGFGLIDIEKVQSINPAIEKNSLAEEIETDNQFAKVYIQYLLGRVIKCEDTDELRKYKTAITPDCMLYKNYVLRKIADKSNRFKFIGKKSISEQIKIKQNELDNIIEQIEGLQKIKNITKELKNADMFNDDVIKYIRDDIERIKQKTQLLEEKEKLIQELDSLDLTWLDKISKEIADLEFEIANLKNEESVKDRTQASLGTKNETLKIEKIPMIESQVEKGQKEINILFTNEWITEFGEPRFKQETESKRLEQIKRISEDQIRKLQNKKEGKLDKVINARLEYVKKYQFSYDVSNKNTNKEFSEELQKLRDIALPQYIDKIKDSKEKAYEQFREDFISKLKANIDEVENQVEELNDALKNSTFGVDKYHFNVKPKQEYKRFYEMMKDELLMEGYNLCSEQFNQKYQTEIDELFKKLTSSDINDETYNKNISIYTDYKTYLSFDLIVTDKEGVVQHLSKTLNKKSGGETQTPFYISVLASFAQLYRINKNRNDNTLRLIVFDEAFNKMDEERMKESLKLLPKFGFQAVIAAPSEKAGEIIPLVPNTLCVIRQGKSTVVREWKLDKVLPE